jgi:hypothetical protein
VSHHDEVVDRSLLWIKSRFEHAHVEDVLGKDRAAANPRFENARLAAIDKKSAGSGRRVGFLTARHSRAASGQAASLLLPEPWTPRDEETWNMRFHEQTTRLPLRVIEWCAVMIGLCWLFIRR